MPRTGGPAGALLSPISQTTPLASCNQATVVVTSQLYLCAVYIAINQVITNINFLSGSQAEASGTHLWFALYDDGRGSSSAGQLALLRQTPDQTGSGAFTANTNLGLALISPYTTTYSGIYYVGFYCVATTMPSILNSLKQSTASFQYAASTGAINGGTAVPGVTGLAPNLTGAISVNANCLYAYLS